MIPTAAHSVPTLPAATLERAASRLAVPLLVASAVIAVLVGLMLEFGGPLGRRMRFLAPVTDKMGSLRPLRWRNR